MNPWWFKSTALKQPQLQAGMTRPMCQCILKVLGHSHTPLSTLSKSGISLMGSFQLQLPSGTHPCIPQCSVSRIRTAQSEEQERWCEVTWNISPSPVCLWQQPAADCWGGASEQGNLSAIPWASSNLQLSQPLGFVKPEVVTFSSLGDFSVSQELTGILKPRWENCRQWPQPRLRDCGSWENLLEHLKLYSTAICFSVQN